MGDVFDLTSLALSGTLCSLCLFFFLHANHPFKMNDIYMYVHRYYLHIAISRQEMNLDINYPDGLSRFVELSALCYVRSRSIEFGKSMLASHLPDEIHEFNARIFE